eukprot:CAMPEP_0198476054 /NCGR_PEP_ID=MMETSP1456-20131121/41124_1 /TAXON_ID=1461544 ORGANISM="Unidentified sp., Strain RCC1871" /NCGR_SAMPLE_ID=MMETSP1456 /ASSEMBLY_ACC=CAM_ASM_001119 /LENGTH=144 /DNA_ID=CAMNT_0044202755 /DNA_START=44 /DNA_END=478 /DNA_ORIENTATION=-
MATVALSVASDEGYKDDRLVTTLEPIDSVYFHRVSEGGALCPHLLLNQADLHVVDRHNANAFWSNLLVRDEALDHLDARIRLCDVGQTCSVEFLQVTSESVRVNEDDFLLRVQACSQVLWLVLTRLQAFCPHVCVLGSSFCSTS